MLILFVQQDSQLYYNSFKTSMLNLEKMFMKSLFAILDPFCKLWKDNFGLFEKIIEDILLANICVYVSQH